MSESRNPFDPRVVLGLVLFGALAFVALLWFIGSGDTGNEPGKGGAHAAGTGLDGYAALSRFLGARGYTVRRAQNESRLDGAGLLVLTPPMFAEGKAIAEVVSRRRAIGPTLVITPKWQTLPAALFTRKAKPGWVMLREAQTPSWAGFEDEIDLKLAPMRAGGKVAAWRGAGASGALPNSESVVSAKAPHLVPLVVGDEDGRILAGYLRDDGFYPALSEIAVGEYPEEGENEETWPVIVVFEPDLLNNFGFADAANARLAEALVAAALDGSDDRTVIFDLTLNGFGAGDNLLTLAFRPPFLAATLALLLAALAVGWRAFNRFGPPARAARAIAFGKRALVGNAAGLIRRTKRLHLIGAPYADAARERLARGLGLPAADPAATEAAIDRALAARDTAATPFSAAAARLRAARRPAELVYAAHDLHALERTLTR
ncbi:MAG: DUF4350 domain-containing protein [Novosphingobium sp.]